MAYLNKNALLEASDLVERDVELPSIGGSVRVRSLPAAYSNQASSEALEMVSGPRGEQTAHVNTAKLENLQVLHALVEPKLNSIAEAETFAKNCGPAYKEIIRVIDEISGVDKEALEKAEARFRAGGTSEANGGSPRDTESGSETPDGSG